MSLFGRREKRRIAELEEQLRAAIEDQVTVEIRTPAEISSIVHGVRKEVWHRATYLFKVVDDETYELADIYLGETGRLDWFDGTTS